MKVKLIFLLGMMCLVQKPGFAQTIKLTVGKNCKAFIALNDKSLLNQHVYDLAVNKGQGLQFHLVNLSKKKIFITVKGTGARTKLDLESLPALFEKTEVIATDDQLNLTLEHKKYNLNESFDLAIGCADGAGSGTQVTFSPVVANSATRVPGQLVSDKPGQEPNSSPGINNEVQNDDAPKEYMPGSAVYDALKLADNQNLLVDEFKKIIKSYFPKDTIDDPNKALLVADSNPFLKQVIDSSYRDLKESEVSIARSGSEIFSIFSASAVGGKSVTNAADGLAKFLVRRVKEELSIAFFKRFKKTIDSIPDLQTLFPATTNLLSSIDTDVYDFQKYIQNLRESFKTDIQALDENFPGIIDNHTAFFDENHALAASLRSACYLIGALKKQVHPGDILASYKIEFLDKESKNWSGSIQTVQLLSASLRDTASSDSTYWVNIKYVRQLMNNKKALQIYFGLLYQMALNEFDSIHFENTSLLKILDELALHYKDYDEYFKKYKLYIMRFGEKVETLNKMIENSDKPANDSLALELDKKYFDASVDLMEYATEVGDLPFINKTKVLAHLHDTLAVYFKVAHETSDLVMDIARKNYSSAINHAVYIYSEIRSKPLQTQALAMRTTGTTKDSLKEEPQEKGRKIYPDSSSKAELALNKFVKYGGFMASVATAKTSEEVSHAIEAFALPVGSSRIKRVSDFNVSLNAYAGLFYGIERIKGVDSGASKFNSFGVAAPVGVSINWGHRLLLIPTGTHEWSTSLFISLIDVGAIAAFRFRDDSTAQVPTIELKDIFSPGAFLSIGIPKTPLSVNLGAQVGPNLRKVGSGKNDYGNNVYWRYSVSLCVDVPILNLYTKSK